MKTSEIRIVNKHLVFEDEGRVILIDTGAPVTFMREGNELEFMGCVSRCNLSPMEMMRKVMGLPEMLELPGISSFESFMSSMAGTMPEMQGMSGMASIDPVKYLDGASKFIGEQVDVMMGTDVLEKYRLLLDYEGKKVTFFEQWDECDFEGTHVLPLTTSMDGHICIEVTVSGKRVMVAVDTGAVIQYLEPRFTEGVDAVRTETDFHDMTGEFTTGIYPVEVSLDGQTQTFEFGNLPEMLQQGLRMSGFAGVIGWDFFSRYKVLLDFVEMEMKWA